MNKLFRLVSRGLLLFGFLMVSTMALPTVEGEEVVNTDTVDQEFVGKLSPMVENAMLAYNALDMKAFYADFSKTMEGLKTEQAFEMLYKTMFMEKYGKYTPGSKELLTAESSARPDLSDVYLLLYTAKFEKGTGKGGLARIAVNFIKEEDAVKIQQIQILDNVPSSAK